jgi:two-component system OmpR family response regulator
MASILLITPDRSFEDYVMQVLTAAGHQLIRTDSAQAARAALTLPVDLVVADSLTPDLGDLRDRLDAAGRPATFVFVSSAAAKAAARDLPMRDADRLVRKPVTPDQLRGAIDETLRAAYEMGAQVNLSGVTFDRVGHRLIRGAEVEQLTLTEFHLLDYLASVRGTIASSAELLDHVWHYTSGTASSEVVRSHLKNLRRKIRAVNEGHDLIETIPRRGYRLNHGLSA